MDTAAEINCSEQNFINQSCFKFDKKQFESMVWVRTGIATAAGVTCCLVILLIWFLKAYKRSVHRFTLYLIIAALLNSVALILESRPVKNECDHVKLVNKNLCIAAGFLDQYSGWIILFLIFWVTLHLFVLAVFKRHYKSRKLEFGCVIISVTVPIAISAISFQNHMYGLSGPWCWIKTTDGNCTKIEEGIIEQVVLGYGPVLLLAIVNFIAMLVVVRVLYKGGR